MNAKKKCFVIMPISGTTTCTEEEWTGIFEHMIKPAVTGSRLGFECERAKPRSGAFIKDILEGLNRSDVVIVDLTDRNPNVCYELGIRHTLKNRTILIAQNMNDVPSDLQSYWVIVYEKDLTGAEQFKKRVREILREMQKNPEKPDSPVADFLKERNVVLLSTQKSENCKKLNALVSELSYNINAIDDILREVKESEKIRGKDKARFRVSVVRFTYSCLELLLSTSYLLLSQKLLRDLHSINEGMRIFNGQLDLWGQPIFTKEVEKSLKEGLPKLKNDLTSLMEAIGKFRLDYINDNYQEPAEPNIVLSSPEHGKYLEIAK